MSAAAEAVACVRHAPMRLLERLASGIEKLVALRHWVMRWLCAVWFALIGLLAFVPAAFADTQVSGAIAVNTQWTKSGSPYVVSGDVVVQNNAVLKVDAGVTVYMAIGASLTVQAGSVQASGTSAEPIRVLSDRTRSGQAAAPGDWKKWVFNAGTANTKIEHAAFEHGSGLAVNGSAPVFNYLVLRHHQGPAIQIDLAASPSGVGNQASNNTLNGIAVPAGDITASTRWGLRGIPYVVGSGVLSVGASPSMSSISPNAIQQGETATLTVNGTRLTGLSEARFEKPGLSAQILAGATATQASLSVTAAATAATGTNSLRLTVDAGEVRMVDAVTVAQSQPTLSSLAPSTLYSGQGAVEVALTGRNFTNQSVVLINGAAVSTQFVSTTQLRASVAASSAVSNLAVRLRTPNVVSGGPDLLSNELTLPVALAQLTLDPATLAAVKGASKTINLSLPYAAGTSGAVVTLVSSVPSVATVPATVTIPAGQTSAAFQLAATDLGTTVITASRAGFVSGQAQVVVVAPPSLTLSPATLTLGVGRTVDLTLQSSAPAPSGGLAIALASSNSAVAAVPATLTIPAGASSVTTQVTSVALGSAEISAQAADYVTGKSAVTVRPTSLNLPAGALVAPGLSRSIPLILSDPAPSGGLVVSLSSANPAKATVPTSVMVPAGQTNVNFTLSGVAAGSTTVNATATGYEASALPVTVEAVTIKFGNPAIDSISLPAEITKSYAVTLSRPAPAGGVLIELATADSGRAVVAPATVSIAEGQTSGGVVQASVTGVAKGSTALSATAPGLTAGSVPVTVTAKPNLSFSRTAVTVGRGLNTYSSELFISRLTDGSGYSPNEAVTINVVSSDPTKAKVPATVTIPAGSSSATLYVTGVDLTGSPVTIDATAPGYTAPTTKLSANVVAPVPVFSSLDTQRSPASARDGFSIYWSTPGAYYSNSQTAAADMPISLSLAEAAPAGIVDGFYGAATGGTPVTQVLVRRGENSSDTVYVGTPTAAGSYKVKGSVPGATTGTSDLVTVSAPQLKFSRSSVFVGKGLNTYYAEVSVSRAVNGTDFSGADAVTVNLTSSDASKVKVPASVTIPANSSSATLYVTGVDLTGGSPVTIDATATGYTAPTTKLSANVDAPIPVFSSLDTQRSPASARDGFSIYWSTPGAYYSNSQTAAADMPISLSLAEAAPAGIVDGFYGAATGGTPVTQVLVRRGENSSDTVYVGTPTAAGSYKVQGSIPGNTTGTSDLVTVSAPQLKFSRSSVFVGKGLNTYYAEVYVSRAVNGTNINGAEALTVSLTSSDATKANVPATVTIPAGSASVYFTVTGVDMTGGAPVTIDAAAAGYTAPASKLSANVVAPVPVFSNLDTARSPASARDGFSIYWTTPDAYYWNSQTAAADMPINLSIVEGTPAGIIDGFYSALTGGTSVTQVLVRKGENSSETVYVGTPTTAGSYKVRGSIPGNTAGNSGVVNVSAPQLKFSASSVTVGKGLKTYSNEVYVSRVVDGANFNGVDAVTISLTCSSSAICTVPASVVIPAGSASVYFAVSGVDLGNTTVTANAIGYNAAQDLPVSVIKPQLVFNGISNPKVGAQTNVTLYLSTPGANYSSSQTATSPLTVNLTSSAPGVATVPASTAIPVGSNDSVSAPLTAVGVGTTSLTASGADLSSATSSVITVNP